MLPSRNIEVSINGQGPILPGTINPRTQFEGVTEFTPREGSKGENPKPSKPRIPKAGREHLPEQVGWCRVLGLLPVGLAPETG